MPRSSARVSRLMMVAVLVVGFGGAVWAGPPPAAPAGAPTPVASAPTSAATRPPIPDYGGRNGSLGSTLDGAADGGAVEATAPLNPLAQVGRAFEALVIVLVVVVGGLVLLKRSGVLKGDGAAVAKGGWAALLTPRRTQTALGTAEGTTEMLALLGSQTLPFSPGAGLHLVAVGGRVLLLGATGQSVTLLTEVAEIAAPPVGRDRVEETPEEVAAFADYLARVGVSPSAVGAGTTPSTLSAATDRLQALVGNRQGK